MAKAQRGTPLSVEDCVSNLLDSEQVYVDLFATSGKWRVPRLPRIAVEEGYRQRAIHKAHRVKGGDIDTCACSGCVRRRNGFELVLDFASSHVHDTSKHVQTTSMQSTRDPLDEWREKKERADEEKARSKTLKKKP